MASPTLPPTRNRVGRRGLWRTRLAVRPRLNLLPIELRDEQDKDTAGNSKVIQALPKQGDNESDNDYIQRQFPASCIAYISGTNTNPEMPHLVAKGFQGIKLKWRLEVHYDRGNGYRPENGYQPAFEDFTRPEDTVRIPTTTQGTDPKFTQESDKDWRIFEDPDWLAEIGSGNGPLPQGDNGGFFGGTAELYVWVPGQTTAPTDPVLTFRIGGKNPGKTTAENFINSNAGQHLNYALAMAREESAGLAQENGSSRYYNQFYTDYQGGPIGDASVEMHWAAWAKAWPTFNLDRDWNRDPKPPHAILIPKTRHQNGAGGYGILQLTLGPKHPQDPVTKEDFIKRRQIWNWQDNVTGAIAEMDGKVQSSVDLYNWLKSNFPSIEQCPGYGHFSVYESILMCKYNGNKGFTWVKSPLGQGGRLSPWKPLANGQWECTGDYVKQVNDFY